MSSALPCKNDVFLSFRTQDTGKNFTSHLYAALCQKGVITFKKDQQSETQISQQQIAQIIHDSSISIVIFSRDFASSARCLDEIVEIFRCMKTKGQIVLPVFYSVDPAEVRKQNGRFGDSFAKHEQVYKNNIKQVQQWRDAATGMANLSGWDIQDRHESDLIDVIVEEVLKKLRKSSHRFSSTPKDVVGMNSRLYEIMHSCIGREGSDYGMRFIGICGMGGIGKTAIAKAVYAELSTEFEGSCFLENVREVEEKNGLISLQEQLLSDILMEKKVTIWDVDGGMIEIKNRLRNRKVLIIIDDVNHWKQLKSLAGKRDWFGNGSRIIITTRDESLLTSHGIERVYRVEGLDHEEALRLFCLKAFKSDYPLDGHVELAYHFVNYANGLPLALDVLGSFLYGRSVDEWQSALDRLKEIPNREIFDRLYLSFEGLQEIEKKVFLDIACFFNGKDKNYVIKVFESCGFYADIGVRVLVNKSLITISNEKIYMHNLLQEMGREIVQRSCYEEPGKRSRLWLYKDVHHVLSNNTGTEQIEGIVLDSCEQEGEYFSAKGFANMRKLRLLSLKNICLSDKLDCLSNKLRYVDWEGYPYKSLPSTFQPDKLVELHLPSSNIEQLWKGIKPLKMLKVIDLSYSVNLIKTIDFQDVPNLEKLNLEGCTRLYEVHQSIGTLKRLVLLNLKNCKSLVKLPDSICDLKSLQNLILIGCSKLESLPGGLWHMKCLEKLKLGGICEMQLASSKPWNSFLPPWFLGRKPVNLMHILPSISVLCPLKSLDLSNCNLTEGALPNDLSCFQSLQSFNLSGNHFVSIPASINRLSKLEDLRFANCKKLQSLPKLPSGILYLSTDGCSSLETLPPKTITRHYEQESLSFLKCERLQSFPDLSSTVVNLRVEGSTADDDCLEKDNAKAAALTFVNCIELVEIEGSSCSVFARLSTYLHFLLRHSSQGLFNPKSHVSIHLAGSEIPEWFKYQGMGSTLEMQLPQHWLTESWMGFALCAEFEVHDEVSATLSCDLHATDKLVSLAHSSTQIDHKMKSEQLWSNYIPRSSLNCGEEFGMLKASFLSKGLKVKQCGFRIIYNHDVGQLIQCHKQLEKLGGQNESDKCKRSINHDSIREAGSEKCGEELHSKRLKILET